jgi:lysophospholipase L1-like esterase
VVAVIPTKESVFARHLEHNAKLSMSDSLDKVIANERLARTELFNELSKENIRYVDLLPAMQKASEREGIYTFAATDMHPNKNGYRVIAETLCESLKTEQATARKTTGL